MRSMRQSGTHGGAPLQLTVSTEENMTRRSEMDTIQRKIEAKVFWDSSVKPVVDANNNSLMWWAKNAHKYSLIAQVAHSTLAVPASSAPSERVFSKGWAGDD